MKTEAWEIWDSQTIHFVSEKIPLLTKNVFWVFVGLPKQTMDFGWLEIIFFFNFFLSLDRKPPKKSKTKIIFILSTTAEQLPELGRMK